MTAAYFTRHRGKGKVFTLKTLREKGIPFTKTHIYRLIRAGRFPKPFYMSERRPAWTETTLDAWIAKREREAAK